MDWSPIDQMILFGGYGVDAFADTWSWDGSTWILR
jgi:hypothetical protein